MWLNSLKLKLRVHLNITMASSCEFNFPRHEHHLKRKCTPFSAKIRQNENKGFATKRWWFISSKEFIWSFRYLDHIKIRTRQTFADGAWKLVLNESISMARAKNNHKIFVQTFLWSSSCGHAFNTASTAAGSSKVTNPNPLEYGYKNRI